MIAWMCRNLNRKLKSMEYFELKNNQQYHPGPSWIYYIVLPCGLLSFSVIHKHLDIAV